MSIWTGVDAMTTRRDTDDIRKRTPLEQAIAEQTDRRARYQAKKAREGFKQTTLLVRVEALEEVKAFVKSVNARFAGPCHD